MLKKIIPSMRGVFIYYQRYGLKRFIIKALQKTLSSRDIPSLQRVYSAGLYSGWIRANEPSSKAITAQKNRRFNHEPFISLVVPCYQTPISFLRQLVESVQQQTYRSWNLHLTMAGDISTETEIYLKKIIKADSRIHVLKLAKNLGTSENTNATLRHTKDEYIGFIDHDDTIAPFALYEVVKAINEQPETDLIYSDEDKITQSGHERHTPHFKPDWSPDLLRSYNYITHFLLIKKSLLDKVGSLQNKYDSCQDYDFVLRASEKAKHICHIPLVLYHWREHANSTSYNPKSKPEVTTISAEVVREHLRRVGRVGKTKPGPFFGSVTISYDLFDKPLVSIIIPNHEHADDLEKCVNSIIEKSTYKNYEIIIMENHSKETKTFSLYDKFKEKGVRVVEWEKAFSYSDINNKGVKEAKGSVILLLNNDVEIITPDWLEQMLMHLQHPEVGVVGAKLYYPDGSIQHAGVVVGIGGVAGHSHKKFSHDSFGYFGRLQVVQNYSAVTGACLMVKKKLFEQVGGLDTKLPIAFNDIDLCLKIREVGYLIVWTPNAQLFHHESKTRGHEDTKEKQQRFMGEVDYFKRKWSDVFINGDSYYNRNLTLKNEDFSINEK